MRRDRNTDHGYTGFRYHPASGSGSGTHAIPPLPPRGMLPCMHLLFNALRNKIDLIKSPLFITDPLIAPSDALFQELISPTTLERDFCSPTRFITSLQGRHRSREFSDISRRNYRRIRRLIRIFSIIQRSITSYFLPFQIPNDLNE